MKDADYLALIESIYDAATNPALWPVFLERCSDAFNGQGTTLYLHNATTRQASVTDNNLEFVHSVRFNPECLEQFEAYYSAVSIWLELAKNLPEGRSSCTSRFCSLSELHQSEFYNDWLKPQDYQHALGNR